MGTVHRWDNTHGMPALTIAPNDKPELVTCPECRKDLEPSTPPSEERYVLDVEANGIVVLTDTTTGTREGFMGPDRLLKATARKTVLEGFGDRARPLGEQDAPLAEETFGEDLEATLAEAEIGTTMHRKIEELQQAPADFLEELTGFARRRRLQAMIEEVRTVEDRALALLAEDTRMLTRATELRHRLEVALKRLTGPSGSPESGQDGSPVGQDPQNAPGPLSAAELDVWRERMTQAFLDVRAGKPHHPRYRHSNERRAS